MSKIYRLVNGYGTLHFFKDVENGHISIRQGGLPEDAKEVLLLPKNHVHGFVGALFTAEATHISMTMSDLELEKMRVRYGMLQQLYHLEGDIMDELGKRGSCHGSTTNPTPTPSDPVNPTPTPTPSDPVNPTPTPSDPVNPTPSDPVNPTPSDPVTPTPTPSDPVNPTPTPSDPVTNVKVPVISQGFVPTSDINPTNPDGKTPQQLYSELLVALRVANDNSDFVYLEEGTYELTEQIRIDAENYPNVKGIIGQGIDKTLIVFSKPQVEDWDSERNLTDPRKSSAIVIDGLNGKTLSEFKLKYTGEFYRPKQTYFGAASGIAITNGNNNSVKRVEVSGFNRAGVYLGGTGDNVKAENAAVHGGRLSVDAMQHHPRDNRVEDSYLHHNRVAGVIMNNQISPRVIENRTEYNGHPLDGGTGYGITAASGSVNVDVVIQRNVVRYNYRKGIDSHDAYDFIVEDNDIYGNRFFGIAIEGRGYPQRNIKVTGNKIHQDPTFRLEVDDDHTVWTDARNSDYYQYTAVRIENKPQSSQGWINQPADVKFLVENNDITGLEQDARKSHRVFELRNHEQAAHVRLDTMIRNNRISGKSVGNLFFIQGEATAANGVGNFVATGNTFKLDSVTDAPISIAQFNPNAVIGGAIDISNNRIDVGDNKGWINLASVDAAVQPLIKFNGNMYKLNEVTHSLLYFGGRMGNPSPVKIEVMNNIIESNSPVSLFVKPADGRNRGLVYDDSKGYPYTNINWHNNRLNSESGEIIPLSGSSDSPVSATPTSNAPDKPVVAGDVKANGIVSFDLASANSYGAYSDDGKAIVTTRAALDATPNGYVIWKTDTSGSQPLPKPQPVVSSKAMIFSLSNESSDDSGVAVISSRVALGAEPASYSIITSDKVVSIEPVVVSQEKAKGVLVFTMEDPRYDDSKKAVVSTREASNARPAVYSMSTQDQVTPVTPLVIPAEKATGIASFNLTNGRYDDGGHAVITTRVAVNAMPNNYSLIGEQNA